MANQAQQTRQSQSQQGPKEYWDLHVTGIGYLNRARWVSVDRGGRKAHPFLSCGINALRGAKDDPIYTPYDVKVSGEEAIELIDSLIPEIQAHRKVLVSFRIGDIYPHTYQRKERDQDGRDTGKMETASLIKGRLLLIYSIKVDGVEKYRRPSSDQAQAQQGQQPALGDPQPAQSAAPVTPKAAAQPQFQPAAQPSPKGAPAMASSQECDVGTACEDYDDEPF